MIKLYLIIGVVWALIFIGTWTIRRMDTIRWNNLFEVCIIALLFVVTLVAWPFSLIYNFKYVVSTKKERGLS